MPKIQKKVVEHFTKTNIYAKQWGVADPEFYEFVLPICKILSPDSKILEVGGGSGHMLDLIKSNTFIKDLYNIEIAYKAYKGQVKENIGLIGGDALNMPFKDECFDCVLMKDVLHHLVGKTRKESKNNALKCIKESFRVLKNEGYLILLEECNKSEIFSSIIFYVTLVLSFLGFSCKALGLRKYVIVSFLTPNEIKTLLSMSAYKIRIIIEDTKKLEVNPKMLKLTLVMSTLYRQRLVIKKCTKAQQLEEV